jgi:hypothetical protein
MGDYIRFLSPDCALDLKAIEALFRAMDEDFRFIIDPAVPMHCEVYYGSDVLAGLDINQADEDVFEEDREALIEEVSASTEPRRNAVLNGLKAARWMLALELYAEGHSAYDRIDQVWDMLFEQCSGLLQIDEEGYYDIDGEVLSME